MANGGETFVVESQEVVLNDGAVGLPHRLMVAGVVGLAADLESAGVTVVHDVPGVGKNMRDHPAV